MSGPRAISGSEVTSFLMCRQQYYYAFVQKIEPKEMSDPLTIGNIGHGALQAYAEARINNADHYEAQVVADNWMSNLPNVTSALDTVLRVKDILKRYHSHTQGWPKFKILGTEQRMDLPITDEFTMPMRYDMYVQDIPTGRKILVDFKFTYDFWPTLKHQLSTQFPKYIVAMKYNGFEVDGAQVEELRYRSMKDMDPYKHFKTTQYNPSIAKKKNAMRQQVMASREIVEWRKQLDQAENPDEFIVPLYNSHFCKSCNFAPLCAAKLDGGDTQFIIESEYTTNSYDYNRKAVE